MTDLRCRTCCRWLSEGEAVYVDESDGSPECGPCYDKQNYTPEEDQRISLDYEAGTRVVSYVKMPDGSVGAIRVRRPQPPIPPKCERIRLWP